MIWPDKADALVPDRRERAVWVLAGHGRDERTARGRGRITAFSPAAKILSRLPHIASLPRNFFASARWFVLPADKYRTARIFERAAMKLPDETPVRPHDT
jgi:hypothetical protein